MVLDRLPGFDHFVFSIGILGPREYYNRQSRLVEIPSSSEEQRRSPASVLGHDCVGVLETTFNEGILMRYSGIHSPMRF